MSLIDYEALARITDKRIIKSRRSIFEGLMALLAEKPLNQITVTELCRRALINRKTFYMQYSSVEEAFRSLEEHITNALLDDLQKQGILTRRELQSDRFIYYLDECRRKNEKEFNVIYPYLLSGDFRTILGIAVGELGTRFMRESPKWDSRGIYASALVFSLCGLTTMYFDWLNLGMQISLEEQVAIARTIMTIPLNECMSSYAGE
ncbi:MAG: TetR/AcrR family transcriptional regulator [Oscillospiraceae bacterium]|nr:TetR/AcrR family transcriptional regulator [Oscillospiraceae bacterium]